MTDAELVKKRLAPLVRVPADGLLVHEIFASIQGESTFAGRPCTFVRATGCNLRCRWCDTPHAFTEGVAMALATVLAKVFELGLPLVEITGGEPLLQPNVLPLMTALCDRGYTVLLETSGTLDVRPVDPRVIKIMDLKPPASGEEEHNRWENLEALGPRDEVKIVLADRGDYDWVKERLARTDLARRCTVILSTVFGRLAPAELAGWILADRLPVRLQLQLHKLVWGPDARGV